MRPAFWGFWVRGTINDQIFEMPVGEKRCRSKSEDQLVRLVNQEGFLSSSFSIRFFSKALVGEHSALSFLNTILTSPSPMRFYMNLVILALAASTLSLALSAPNSVRVRESTC
jgi:hypothetical protein